jgi:NADH-quinone oxidoreductase subunit J
MVLFTFVVMLLNVGEEEKTHGSKIAKAIGFPAVVAVLAVIASAVIEAQKQLGQVTLSDGVTTTKDLSAVLFRDLLLPFELTSVLVLIAILGAVALARKEGSQS